MTKTLKNILEDISSSQMARLKKEYEPLRKIDMSKHKGQIEKTTAMLSKLKMGTLIDLSKEDIPVISDVAKSLVKKDKRFAHHVESVVEEVQLDEARKLLVKDFRMVIKIAIKHINDMESAINDIEKYKKGLSNHPDVMDILKKANEEVEEMFSTRSLGLSGASKRSRERARAKEKEQKKSKKKEEVEEIAGVQPMTGPTGLISAIKVKESLIMGLNKSSAEYKAGKAAAKKGEKYDANPHAPGVKRLNWSTGHNDFRADNLRKAGKPNYGARGQFEDTEIGEADLTKTQIKMVHKQADELPKHDFIKRYGKDGDAVRYATATNQVKKKLGIEN